MKLTRRHFIGALGLGAAGLGVDGLGAPRAFAAASNGADRRVLAIGLAVEELLAA